MAKIMKRITRASIAVAGAAVLVATGAVNASAATPRNGVCEVGEICFYWGSYRTGSLSDHTGSLSNYGSTQPGCYEFKSEGVGENECIKNNAYSVWNRRGGSARVYFNSNYGGDYDVVAANSWRNLNVTASANASHRLY